MEEEGKKVSPGHPMQIFDNLHRPKSNPFYPQGLPCAAPSQEQPNNHLQNRACLGCPLPCSSHRNCSRITDGKVGIGPAGSRLTIEPPWGL